jgi:hypothetical protein
MVKEIAGGPGSSPLFGSHRVLCVLDVTHGIGAVTCQLHVPVVIFLIYRCSCLRSGVLCSSTLRRVPAASTINDNVDAFFIL